MNDDSSHVPVLFMIFNRPDATARVFDNIRKARPQRLYVAADGPRQGRLAEEALCAKSRQLTEDIDWPCEVHRLYRGENLGCKRAISSAINWFFEHEEAGIILEDDCLPDPSFFPFCKTMLERYKNEQRVMMISGNDFTLKEPGANDSYYFATYFPIWGWATWRRAWERYDIGMSEWPSARDSGLIRKQIGNRRLARWMEDCMERTYLDNIDTWDFQWTFACLRHNGVSLCPFGNLVSNIGYEGTHIQTTARDSMLLGLPLHHYNALEEVRPGSISPKPANNRSIYRSVLKEMHTGGWVGRMDALVYNTWKKVRGNALGRS